MARSSPFSPRSALVIGLALALAVSTGCKKRSENNDEGAGQPGKPRIGLVFDIGGLGDKSFNDAAHRGLMKAHEKLGVGVKYIEPGEGAQREAAMRQLAAKGYDLVIGVGFLFSEDITKLARAFPDVKFACIDYNPPADGKVPDNLAGLRFREHEGSFLVGAIAGKVTKTKTVGFVGGMKIPLIRKFEAGYTAGVKHACPDCSVLSGYAGTTSQAFTDPVKGQELALSQYGKGADIIFHASGKTGDGVFNAAKKQDKLVIGVDSDQYEAAPCCVLTSMIKKVDVAVFDTIEQVHDKTFQGGVREFGLADNGVGFVADDRNKDKLPQAVVDEVNALAKQIIDGTIQVPSQ